MPSAMSSVNDKRTVNTKILNNAFLLNTTILTYLTTILTALANK